MKKIFVILPMLLVLTGCGKIKIENHTLYLTESEMCDYATIYEDKDVLVKSYCVDSAKIKTSKDEEVDLKKVLDEKIIDIKDTLDGQIKESEEKDGSVVLRGKENNYRIVICDESYSEKDKYVLVPMMNYEDFMCKY